MKLTKNFPVFGLALMLCVCTIAEAQTPSPTTYGCRPANQVMYFNPECQRVITTDEIRLGQGRVAGFNNEVSPGLDVVIPTNRPDWAISTYHYHVLMSNYTGRKVDIHTAMLSAMKETVMTCDPTAAYVYGTDPVNNPWSTRITNLAGTTVTPNVNRYPLNTAQSVWQNHELTIYDGCMQIDPTGIATLRTPPGDMAWRWGKTGTFVDTYHNGTLNPSGSKQSVFLNTKYIGRRKSYIYGCIGKANYDTQTIVRRRAEDGIDIPTLANAAKDPYSLELTLARSYNQGQWDGTMINILKDANFINSNRIYNGTFTSNGTRYFTDGTPASASTGYYYWKQIENGFYVLNDNVANAVLGSKTDPLQNQFYGYYDCLLDWDIIRYYIDLFIKPQKTISPFPNPQGAEPSLPVNTSLPVFYAEITDTAGYVANVKAAWNQAIINSAARRGLAGNVPDNKISFRFDAKPVLDAIILQLPVDQPNLACKTCTGVNTEIIYDKTNLAICPGQFVKMEASPQASSYKYQWLKDGVAITNANGGWAAVYLAKTAGTYTLEITDANGCTVKTECLVVVTDKTGCSTCALTASSTATAATCTGVTNATISVSLASGTGNYTYKWTGPTNGTNTTAATSYSIAGATEGKYTIEITDNGVANCKKYADIDVKATKSLKATATAQAKVPDNCSTTLTANLIDNAVTCKYYITTADGFGGNSALSAKLFADGALIGSPVKNNQNNVAFDVPIGAKIEVKFSVSNSWSFQPSRITLRDPSSTIISTVTSSMPTGTAPYTFENTVITTTSTCTLPYAVTYAWTPTSGLTPNNAKTVVANPSTDTDYQATITMTASPFCVIKTNTITAKNYCATSQPVELINFEAAAVMNHVQVSWQTASEKNCHFFVVESSFNGKDFYPVGTTDCKGGKSVTSYSLNDYQYKTGTVYYRLAQHDEDGTINYSAVKALNIFNKGGIQVIPNPFTNQAEIVLDNIPESEMVTAIIYDMNGRQISERLISHGGTRLPIGQELGAGVYLVHILTDTDTQTLKIIKK